MKFYIIYLFLPKSCWFFNCTVKSFGFFWNGVMQKNQCAPKSCDIATYFSLIALLWFFSLMSHARMQLRKDWLVRAECGTVELS